VLRSLAKALVEGLATVVNSGRKKVMILLTDATAVLFGTEEAVKDYQRGIGSRF
jgi:hypothetical protein